MVISGCVLGLMFVVAAVAIFVTYRARRNRRKPNGKGGATLGGGHSSLGTYFMDTIPSSSRNRSRNK